MATVNEFWNNGDNDKFYTDVAVVVTDPGYEGDRHCPPCGPEIEAVSAVVHEWDSGAEDYLAREATDADLEDLNTNDAFLAAAFDAVVDAAYNEPPPEMWF